MYSGTPGEKKLLFKIMQAKALRPDQMKQVEGIIRDSRVPMKDFQEIATNYIDEYIRGEKND